MTTRRAAQVARAPAWPWLLLALAIGWVVLVRVPIVVNAPTHLDSDLAVDGLTVAEVARGHWRWHFPGTPYIGIASALCAAPQMRLWGATPESLASGGVVAYVLLVVAIFLAAWEAFGPRVACWSLVPLAFASNGVVWLSGRLNGGHLLAAAWHAGALGLFHALLARGGWKRAGLLGLWCGLGLWHDAMFLITVVTLVAVGAGAAEAGRAPAWSALRRPHWAFWSARFLASWAAGSIRMTPTRAKTHPFSPPSCSWNTPASWPPSACRGSLPATCSRICARSPRPPLLVRTPGKASSLAADALAWANTSLCLTLFLAAVALVTDGNRPAANDIPRRATRWAILASTAIVLAGFVVNKNIYNSDNYRYIIYLFVTWTIGFGLALDWLSARGLRGALLATALALALAVLQTLDTAQWYRRLGWIDSDFRPVRVPLRDPLFDWLSEHPEVRSIFGDYWDVYRITFLTGGRVRGIPFPFYPNRYPEWSNALRGGRPEVLVARPSQTGRRMLQAAKGEGARALSITPGLAIYNWPVRE